MDVTECLETDVHGDGRSGTCLRDSGVGRLWLENDVGRLWLENDGSELTFSSWRVRLDFDGCFCFGGRCSRNVCFGPNLKASPSTPL